MPVLQSLEEFQALLVDRPEQTRTFQIDPGIAADLHEIIQLARSGAKMREMDSAEIEELARYLEVPVGELATPMTVSDIRCSGCGRRLNITDLAKTGVDDGLHAKGRLAAVLCGKAGQWVTVRGKDGGRFANCSACGRMSATPFIDYTCGVVAYAWA